MEENIDADDGAALVMAAAAAAPNPIKKKPGRPKKKPVAVPVEFLGIVGAPLAPDDVFEMSYNNPSMFKKILQIEKGYEPENIEIVCTATHMLLISEDHSGQCNICITIAGRFMNYYYARHQLRFFVKREDIGDVFGSITKEHSLISFVLHEANYRSVLYISTEDSVLSKKMTYGINIVTREDAAEAREINCDIDYPLVFVLAAKDLKNMIANIKKMSSFITFLKIDGEPLRIKFIKDQNAITADAVYDDPEKIKMRCALGQDMLCISVSIDYIKPFSNSNIGDDVEIAVDRFKKMSTTAFLDKMIESDDLPLAETHACVVKIYIKIKV